MSTPTDIWDRYTRAATAYNHHTVKAAEAQCERDKAMAELNAAGVSYQKLADRTGLTRAGVQKAVERGRTI